jgi:hypothetical protein
MVGRRSAEVRARPRNLDRFTRVMDSIVTEPMPSTPLSASGATIDS